MAPTRELAVQIHEQCSHFGKPVGVRSVAVYGGDSKFRQICMLEEFAPQIVIATPGRLHDLCQSGKLSLENVRHLVLDEADLMLDMGFQPQLDAIESMMEPQVRTLDERRRLHQMSMGDVNYEEKSLHSQSPIPKARQTLMFSATWPRNVQNLARQYLVNPVQINVGNATGSPVVNKNIRQTVHVLPRGSTQVRNSFSSLFSRLRCPLKKLTNTHCLWLITYLPLVTERERTSFTKSLKGPVE